MASLCELWPDHGLLAADLVNVGLALKATADTTDKASDSAL